MLLKFVILNHYFFYLFSSSSNETKGGFECGECGQVFRTRGSLRKHLNAEHVPNEPEPAEHYVQELKCNVSMCGFSTTHRGEFDSHVMKHMGDGWTPTGKKRHNKNPLQRHR